MTGIRRKENAIREEYPDSSGRRTVKIDGLEKARSEVSRVVESPDIDPTSLGGMAENDYIRYTETAKELQSELRKQESDIDTERVKSLSRELQTNTEFYNDEAQPMGDPLVKYDKLGVDTAANNVRQAQESGTLDAPAPRTVTETRERRLRMRKSDLGVSDTVEYARSLANAESIEKASTLTDTEYNGRSVVNLGETVEEKMERLTGVRDVVTGTTRTTNHNIAEGYSDVPEFRSESMKQYRTPMKRRVFENIERATKRTSDTLKEVVSQDTSGDGGSRRGRLKQLGGAFRADVGSLFSRDEDGGFPNLPGLPGGGGGGKGSLFGGAGDGAKDSIVSIRKALGKLVPTMMVWWNMVAAVIPLLVVLAGAALGAAAAIGILGVAGAAIGGLGLLAYDDPAQRLKDLQKELKDVFMPAAEVFQPIVERFLTMIPGEMEQLVEPLKNLRGYEDFFHNAFGGAVDWVESLITVMSSMEKKVEAIGSGVGKIFGQLALDLIVWAINELASNWNLFTTIGGIFLDLIVIIYNVSKALAFVLATFEPLIRIVAAISTLFGTKWFGALLSVIAALVMLNGLMGFFMTITKAAVLQKLAAGFMLIAGNIWKAFAAASALRAVLMTLGIGIVLAAVGMLASEVMDNTGSGMPGTGDGNEISGGGGGGYSGGYMNGGLGMGGSSFEGGGSMPAGGATFVFNGDVGRREELKFRDKFPGHFNKQNSMTRQTRRSNGSAGEKK